jgi:hypothetical protein
MADSEQLTPLAPGSGAGLGRKLAEELATRPGFVRKLADAYEDGLTATTSRWNSKDSTFEDIPDHKTRVLAANAIMANMVGEPVKRVMVAQNSGKNPSAAKETAKLSQSAALRRSLQRKLDAAAGRSAPIEANAELVPEGSEVD